MPLSPDHLKMIRQEVSLRQTPAAQMSLIDRQNKMMDRYRIQPFLTVGARIKILTQGR